MNNIYSYIRYTDDLFQYKGCSRLCFTLFNHSETAVRHLNGRRLDHRKFKPLTLPMLSVFIDLMVQFPCPFITANGVSNL
jgi:hypothetical protein